MSSLILFGAGLTAVGLAGRLLIKSSKGAALGGGLSIVSELCFNARIRILYEDEELGGPRTIQHIHPLFERGLFL